MSGIAKPTKPRAMAPPSRPTMSRPASSARINGRSSPTGSVASSRARSPVSQIAGAKRKEREQEDGPVGSGAEETNINVVVRCRGRNDREVRENSGVVVSTDGVKGRTVELAMGPSALSNKMYHFDKVFSPAADQNMIFEEVVAPVLDEVLSGFNCTIFAYGQTGTGKTYTMSGDITDMLPLSDNAGIIPRVLHGLFTRLESAECENSVKASFIELYNEELRDLLSRDDNVKLKIYEENNKRGSVSTVVQGMEESHITSASKGLQLLREGSHKRQVAATKCNDLSSRSHTVFTITVYMKRTTDTGEEYVSAGKLNLVDLAGSENIQRSGAENKRAAEAGLINKSLLTLGRVINALVEKSSHIPYRESKLTRLLQDSLGGRTKTCIIATLSPAKSNLEETISTLDYAFRAKNIKNKPQVNQMVSKKTLLKEFTAEIEKLKSELIATRQRNGVHLTPETYEELITESESRRILTEEQKDKIETMEANLRTKVQELFSLTTNFSSLKKDNEAAKMLLDGTKSILEKTEVVLAHTQQSLDDETQIRMAHQRTEEKLTNVGRNLLSTLSQTTSDVDGLQSKLRRRSNQHSTNRDIWRSTQQRIDSVTSAVEDRLGDLQSQQQTLVSALSSRMDGFIRDELDKLGATHILLNEKAEAFETSQQEINGQNEVSRDELNAVLQEIKLLREEVKQKVGSGLEGLNAAAQRISAGIMGEIESFHTELHGSYASLGRDFKGTFDELLSELADQQTQVNKLHGDITAANQELASQNITSAEQVAEILAVERRAAQDERESLMTQIGALISAASSQQEQRLERSMASWRSGFDLQQSTHAHAQATFDEKTILWQSNSVGLINKMTTSRDSIKNKLKSDFATASDRTASLRTVTTSVYDSTTQIVQEQVAHLDTELHALDDIVERIQEQNNTHHQRHIESLSHLSQNVRASYEGIGSHFTDSFSRIESLGADMTARCTSLVDTLPTIAEAGAARAPLREMRNAIDAQTLEEYAATGKTPQRTTYTYPSILPHTATREVLISKLRNGEDLLAETDAEMDMEAAALNSSVSSDAAIIPRSPSKQPIFTDSPAPAPKTTDITSTLARPTSAPLTTTTSLRELDINTLSFSTTTTDLPATKEPDISMPPLKRLHTTGSANTISLPLNDGSKLPTKKRTMRMTVATVRDDRENLPAGGEKSLLSRSVGPGAANPLTMSGMGISGQASRRRVLRSQGSS